MAHFSKTYHGARQNFRQAAYDAGADVKAVKLINDLEVDCAFLGNADQPTLVITSGLHGVEGFFGSAVQSALLNQLQHSINRGEVRVVFVHGLNPYGFEQVRRFDQDNIDLNRNFPLTENQYQSAPDGYKKLNRFLNPQSPPSAAEPYRLKALLNILRYGMPALKEAIVCGQYQYPEGIFYGGCGVAAATDFVMAHCSDWVGDAEVVMHIDLHSGLGEFGKYKLLLNDEPGTSDYSWYVDAFGEQSIAGLQKTDDTAYAVSGAMGVWLQKKFSDRKYYFAGAEFGTYDPVRVLGAIRAENRAHHYASPGSREYIKAKAELFECFCPASDVWRKQVIESSMQIMSLAIKALQ